MLKEDEIRTIFEPKNNDLSHFPEEKKKKKMRRTKSRKIYLLTFDTQSQNFSIFSHFSVLLPLHPSSSNRSHW